MAKFYGHNSSYIKSIKNKSFLYAFIGILVLLSVIVYILTLNFFRWSLSTLFLIVGILLAILKIIDLFTNKEITNFLKADHGLKGEKIISQILGKLPDTFSIYHGLKFPNHGDIDFTVVGPTGVFTIEVKSHSGKIDFDGQELTLNGRIFKEKNIFRQAFSESMTLHEHLLQKTGQDIFVTPIIVFSSDKVFIHLGQNKINNVYVIQKDWLLEIINKQSGFDTTRLPAIEKALVILLSI